MTIVKTYYPGGRTRPISHRRPDHDSDRRWGEQGEGVISAAIAVLIMAFIGVGMWVAFNNIFEHTATNVDNQVNKCIGQTSSNC
jgi:hypothetical protein